MKKETSTLSDLIGKTIIKAEIKKISEMFDDEPYLFLTMDNGEIFKITADYGGYTGNSEDEYKRFISIDKILGAELTK